MNSRASQKMYIRFGFQAFDVSEIKLPRASKVGVYRGWAKPPRLRGGFNRLVFGCNAYHAPFVYMSRQAQSHHPTHLSPSSLIFDSGV